VVLICINYVINTKNYLNKKCSCHWRKMFCFKGDNIWWYYMFTAAASVYTLYFVDQQLKWHYIGQLPVYMLGATVFTLTFVDQH